MTKQKLLSMTIVTAMTINFVISPVFAQTPTPSSTTPASEEVTENLSSQINNLKEKIASRVAQLNLVEKRGVIGTVQEVKGTQITLTTPQGDTRVIDVDEITKFSSSSDSGFGLSDIEKNDTLSVIGLYNKESERILARFVTVTTIPQFLSGGVTSIDDENSVITVTTPDEKDYKVDIENVTKVLAYSGDDLETPTRAKFSSIERGTRIVVVGYPDNKEKNRITATRVLLFSELPQNPRIVIPDQAVDTEKVTTSTGSANKLTPLR